MDTRHPEHQQVDDVLAALARQLEPADRAVDVDDTPPMRAAVAVLLRPSAVGDDLELLLIRRADRIGDVWSGHIALPGGRHEPDDASLVDTARRETMEEVDVDLAGASLLGALPTLEPVSPQLPQIAVHPFVWRVSRTVEPRADEAEVAATRWVTLTHLQAIENRIEHALVVPELGEKRFPAISIGEPVPLWGMTHRIVETLLERIEFTHG